ncbi:MAG: hypothetical protein ACOX5R_19580 [bacterium]|jgi:hypothetical protein
MNFSVKRVRRRQILKSTAGLLLVPIITGCAGLGVDEEPDPQVDVDVLWSRRQEWTGKEVVRGIVNMGDRYLMVRGKDHLGWVFPGGRVDAERHGQKTESTRDLMNAVTEYVHDQALVQVWAKQTTEVAYGYGIDDETNELIMIHWLEVAIPSKTLPSVHANLKDTEEARWVALDDSDVGYCLQLRLDEIQQALTPLKESGGTVLLQFCN